VLPVPAGHKGKVLAVWLVRHSDEKRLNPKPLLKTKSRHCAGFLSSRRSDLSNANLKDRGICRLCRLCGTLCRDSALSVCARELVVRDRRRRRNPDHAGAAPRTHRCALAVDRLATTRRLTTFGCGVCIEGFEFGYACASPFERPIFLSWLKPGNGTKIFE
jgi:hypothetical protein